MPEVIVADVVIQSMFQHYFEFCVCRFQELDLSTNAYIFSGSVREEEWYNKVIEGLHPKANYRKV